MKIAHATLRRFGITTHRRYRLFIRAVALILGLIAAFETSVLLELRAFSYAMMSFSVVLAAAVLEFVFADVLADRNYPFDTERKLALMENKLGSKVIGSIAQRLNEAISEFRGCDTSRISTTVHLLTELAPTSDHKYRQGLIQLTGYVGPEGGKKGRITLLNQGVIGRCARSGDIEFADFADADEYRYAMVRGFGFTRDEAASHTASGRSYLAYPLQSDNRTDGVLFFFSTDPQVFPHAANTDRLKDIAREIRKYLEMAELV